MEETKIVVSSRNFSLPNIDPGDIFTMDLMSFMVETFHKEIQIPQFRAKGREIKCEMKSQMLRYNSTKYKRKIPQCTEIHTNRCKDNLAQHWKRETLPMIKKIRCQN